MMRFLAIFVLIAGVSGPAAAEFEGGFERGLAAYSQGDFDGARAAFEPLAETDSRAQFYLGRMYFRGQGVVTDEARGMALFERAAERGEASAMSALAEALKKRGETQKAFEWVTRAAEAGLPFAQAELGLRYETGNGAPQDRREAVIWYGKAAGGGSAIGAARLYRLGAEAAPDKHGSPDDVRQRIDRAHSGDSQARFELATLFTDVGAHAQAMVWYRLAANQGHHEAEYQVGLSLLTGRGVARNEVGAFVWFRRAVGGAHAAAMYRLGNAYRIGLGGIDVNEGLALEWYENAIKDGYSAATHELVDLYVARAARALKAGDPAAARKEIVEAIAWSERGVKLGDPEVSYAFAKNLYEGFGDLTFADVRSAMAFYEIAAQQGSLAAARELALLFSGASVSDGRDAIFPTVYFWNAILEADDPDDRHGFGQAAATKLAELAGRLTESEIAGVMRRVAAWRAEYRMAPGSR